MAENVFADEWRECLREQYMYVVRSDPKTLGSLRTVMLEAGFRDADLRELAVRATAHVDDVAPDFVPDLDILQPESAVEQPQEETHGYHEQYNAADEPPAKADPNSPQQLSLF